MGMRKADYALEEETLKNQWYLKDMEMLPQHYHENLNSPKALVAEDI